MWLQDDRPCKGVQASRSAKPKRCTETCPAVGTVTGNDASQRRCLSHMLLCCRDVTVLVLDRPRHAQLIKEIRAAGARIRMISDGDVSGAPASVWRKALQRRTLRGLHSVLP